MTISEETPMALEPAVWHRSRETDGEGPFRAVGS